MNLKAEKTIKTGCKNRESLEKDVKKTGKDGSLGSSSACGSKDLSLNLGKGKKKLGGGGRGPISMNKFSELTGVVKANSI